MTSPDPLQAIAERLAKATPGPWYVEGDNIREQPGGGMIIVKRHRLPRHIQHPTNDFIAHTPTDQASLLALVRAGEQMAEAVREADSLMHPGMRSDKMQAVHILSKDALTAYTEVRKGEG